MSPVQTTNILERLSVIHAELNFARGKAKTDNEVVNIDNALAAIQEASTAVENI